MLIISLKSAIFCYTDSGRQKNNRLSLKKGKEVILTTILIYFLCPFLGIESYE